jgi:hypothetical protein
MRCAGISHDMSQQGAGAALLLGLAGVHGPVAHQMKRYNFVTIIVSMIVYL